MKNNDKKQISEEVFRLSKQLSQNRIAKRAGVSSATISQIINGNWQLIKPSMWRKIKVKLKIDFTWATAKTSLYNDLTNLLSTAQSRHLTLAFSHKAGAGKTHLFNAYQKQMENVIYIEGSRTMSKKTYIKSLLSNAGQENHGTTEQLLEQFTGYISELENPLIIIDQFDKLKEGPFDLFMDFYNDLFGNCAFIISGVKALEKRILLGVQRQKIGYEEIWSRMNRKFIELLPVTFNDVKLIFIANKINDTDAARESYNGCEGDLRRVRQDVERYHLTNN